MSFRKNSGVPSSGIHQQRNEIAVKFAVTSRALAIVISLAGCSVLIGWIFNIPALKSVAPAWATMKPNAALCFLFLGISLIFVTSGVPRPRYYPVLPASITLLISVLTIFEYSTGADFRIDQLLFEDLQASSGFPGRMAPATALSFTALGTALVLTDVKRARWIVESLIFLSAFISGLALIGYLYGVESLYTISNFSSVAIHTALLTSLLSAGILFARPASGVMRTVASDNGGGILTRRLLPLSLVVLASLGYVRLLGQREGLYDTAFGLSLFVAVMASILIILIIWTGSTVSRIDTNRQKAEAALRRSEETYRHLFKSNPHPMWVYDVESLAFLAVNDAAVMRYGYTEKEFLSMTILNIRPPEDIPEVLEAVRALSPESASTVSRRHRLKDGTMIDVEVTSRELYIGGRCARLVLVTDLTERKRAQAELQESEERYRTVTETASDAMITIDEDSRILFVNQAAERTFGYTRSEVIGRPLTILMPEAFRQLYREGLKRYTLTGERNIAWDGTELCGLHKSGEEIPLEVSFGEFTRNSRRFFTGIVRDITDRKRTAEMLRNTNQTLRSLIETSPVAIIALDQARRVTIWNPAAQRIFGWTEEEVIGQSFPLSLAVDESVVDRSVGDVATAELVTRCRIKDGSLIDVMMSSAIQNDDLGNPSGTVIIIADITEQKSLEQQLRQSQKMEAIGELAGGIAHDFNNLLTVIAGYCELAAARDPNDPALRQDLAFIKQAGDRATRLVSQLLAFSRKQVLQPRVLDLNELVTEADKMLRRLISEEIDLVSITRPRLGRVLADAGQIEQTILNLAINARDAMPQGGKLTIETDNVELDEGYCKSHPEVAPGRYVLLAVSDTGHGMDLQIQSRVFEPFFTTKELGKGTGLGLAIVFGIVKQSGGHIWLYSEPGRGTTFKVYLPRIDDSPASDTHVDSIASLRGSETLLIAEDDDAVRRLTKLVLEGFGYRVIEASSGADALLKERDAGEIAMLVTDVVMPRMSGKELVSRIREVRPDLPVLYLSGYTEDAIVHHGVLEEGLDFLPKPFSPENLARKVREVLDRRS